MKKRVHEDTLRTILLALAGLAMLVAMLPEWAEPFVLVFAALYAVLVVLVDDDIRALLFRRARAKSPVSRRAAT